MPGRRHPTAMTITETSGTDMTAVPDPTISPDRGGRRNTAILITGAGGEVGHGLISALQKLEATARRVPMQNEMPTQNHMFIVQPLSAGGLAGLFSTHPKTADRVAKLRELA